MCTWFQIYGILKLKISLQVMTLSTSAGIACMVVEVGERKSEASPTLLTSLQEPLEVCKRIQLTCLRE